MAVLRKKQYTGLKATTLTTVLELNGRGALRSFKIIDPDNLTQNERIQITIDGEVVFNKADWDVGNTAEIMDLFQSIETAVLATITLTATIDRQYMMKQRIPFHKSLKIEYLRAAAGTAGLTIDTMYEIKTY